MMLNGKVLLASYFIGMLMISAVQAQEGLKAGLGIGIPYGLLGGNLEYGLNDHVAVNGGLGITPAGLGWAVGARLYGPKMGDFRPRLSALHGVVAILETQYWYGETNYESLTGEAFGPGVEWTMPSGFALELDLLVVNVDIPSAATQQGGDVKLSIGFSKHF